MRYSIRGLDCPDCAAKIEAELNKIPGLEQVKINFSASSLDLPPDLIGLARATIERVDSGVRLEEGAKAALLEAGQKNHDLLRIIVSGLLFILGIILPAAWPGPSWSWAAIALFAPAYLLVGGPVILKAAKNLLRGRLLDENFLMTLATLGAIAIRQLPEAVSVMLFYAVGEYLQERAVDRSRRSIAALLRLQPEYANLRINGDTRQVDPRQVAVGQVILVKPGEKVPLDGVVLEGVSFLNTAALTGESVPRKTQVGERVLAGMVNGQGLLTVKVTKPFADSSLARILDLVERAGERKAPTEKYITKFARYYTPAVVGGAALVAILPPLVLPGALFSQWLYRALVLLVISCPCALVVSIPLGYFGGIGAASKNGILVKGANYIDSLANLDTVVFDKTGTLTKGVFRVSEIIPRAASAEEVLAAAAGAEVYSNHPIALSIREAYREMHGGAPVPDRVEEYREIPALGVSAVVDGRRVLAGNDRLMHSMDIPHEDCQAAGTRVYVAIDGVYAGYLVISDEVKGDAKEALHRLRRLGIRRTVMLSGDDADVTAAVSQHLGMDAFFAELLPEDKVAAVEEMERELKGKNRRGLAFVGDGVNDAPVLARAEIGVAMGGLGSDAAIEAADVVLMEAAPAKLARGIEIARRTRQIVRQNIFLALGIKVLFVFLGVLGVANIWEAIFADVGVTILAVLNAGRTAKS